jgi:hypothetical protein
MRPLYYQHSGAFSIPGLLAASVAAMLAGLILAVAYAYTTLYIPLAGFVTFLLTGGYGALLGASTGFLLRWGRVRNGLLAGIVATVVALVSWWFSWCVWLDALLGRAGQDASVLAIVLQPGAMWDLVRGVNRTGAWSIAGGTPTGVVLWILWLVEAAIVLGLGILLAQGILTGDPYCERCGTWCAKKPLVVRFPPELAEGIKARAESKDLAGIATAERAAAGSAGWTQLSLHACPRCEHTRTLSVLTVTEKVDEKGKASQSETIVADKLLLSREEAAALEAMA